jgi:hypothetical protein
VRLVVLAIDWLVNYWTRWVHLRGKGYTLVSEHTYFDLVVEPQRYGYSAGPRLARTLSWLLPKPDVTFFLDSESDVLWHRKEESAPSQLMSQEFAYRAFVCRRRDGHVLNGNLPLSALVDEVQRVIRAWMFDRFTVAPGRVQNLTTTAPAVTAECSTVHSSSVDGGHRER